MASVFGFIKKTQQHLPLELDEPNALPFCSVIIAARNEEASIGTICNDLLQQTYPKEKTEFILIDDHSDDYTAEIINTFVKQDHRFILTQAPEEIQGKKQALRYALSKAQGDLLLFTDADCSISAKWIETYAAHTQDSQASFYFGGIVPRQPNSISESFFRLDFIGILAVQSGLARLNHAFSCNGANMCITRKFYTEQYNTNESYASGDDVFLLQQAKKTKNNVKFIADFSARVRTGIPSSWSEFLNQRSRWSSKVGGYKDNDTIAVAVIVYAICFVMSALFVATVVTGNEYFLDLWFKLFLIKTACDLIIFDLTSKYFETKYKSNLLTPFFEFIYPFYIVIIPIFAMLVPTKWKARQIQK